MKDQDQEFIETDATKTIIRAVGAAVDHQLDTTRYVLKEQGRRLARLEDNLRLVICFMILLFLLSVTFSALPARASVYLEVENGEAVVRDDDPAPLLEVHPAIAPDAFTPAKLLKIGLTCKKVAAYSWKPLKYCYDKSCIVGKYSFDQFCTFGKWSEKRGLTQGLQATGSAANVLTPILIQCVK